MLSIRALCQCFLSVLFTITFYNYFLQLLSTRTFYQYSLTVISINTFDQRFLPVLSVPGFAQMQTSKPQYLWSQTCYRHRAIIALTAPLTLTIPREFSAWTKFPSRSTAEASCILKRWWHVLRITLRQRMERLPYCIVQTKECLNPSKRKASCSDSILKRQTS